VTAGTLGMSFVDLLPISAFRCCSCRRSIRGRRDRQIAPQTASVGVSTSKFVRIEGEVIRHNFGWCLLLLGYLVIIGVACYLFFPNIAVLPGRMHARRLHGAATRRPHCFGFRAAAGFRSHPRVNRLDAGHRRAD
jgi:hypothetical protein